MWAVACHRFNRAGRSPAERALMGAHLCAAYSHAGCCRQRRALGEEVWEVFQSAGEPYHLRDLLGFPVPMPVLVACRLPGEIWGCHLCGPAAASGAVVATHKVDAVYKGFLLGGAQCIEATWEPYGSPRVQRLRQQRLKLGAPKKPVRTSHVPVVHLQCLEAHGWCEMLRSMIDPSVLSVLRRPSPCRSAPPLCCAPLHLRLCADAGPAVGQRCRLPGRP